MDSSSTIFLLVNTKQNKNTSQKLHGFVLYGFFISEITLNIIQTTDKQRPNDEFPLGNTTFPKNQINECQDIIYLFQNVKIYFHSHTTPTLH